MPSDIAAPAANYAHARLTTGAGRWLHTSGVVAIAPDGGVPGAALELMPRARELPGRKNGKRVK